MKKTLLFLVFSGILLLSGVDACLTLKLIEVGATELNPVMDYCLTLGMLPFIFVKTFLTIGGLILLFINRNYERHIINIKRLSTAVLILYVFVVGYELILIK